ncbi:MAG: hypothetical protein HZA01_08745 [Nitrospinae bacterium]|nr:hypothetical protein [Nitrospinota bacterium]
MIFHFGFIFISLAGFIFISLAGFIFISGLAGLTARFAEGKIKGGVKGYEGFQRPDSLAKGGGIV